jgi:DNA transformation protein and related proteins
MFGGAGIYRDGVMFGLIAGNEIYLKADDETVARFREAGSRAFVYSREGKAATMSYWSLPDAALDDPDIVKTWADLAFAAALRTAKQPKARAAAGAEPSPGPRPEGSARARPSGRNGASRPER